MKFPYELSKERISLLSPEDRQIYEFEHSGLCSDMLGLVENVGFIEEDAQIRKIMDQYLFESEFDSLFDKDIIEAVGEDEYMNIKKNLYEFIENDPEMKGELFEAQGHAAYWWMDFKIGWLGKLAAGLLTGLLGLVAWLLMKGKDRLAMVKLKQYMNKLVELIDMGVNKKRPWYSFLMLSKKKRQNTGDYNKACFRTIQETAERNMACLYTQCIHNLGFLNPGITDFRGITSGMLPEDGSGLGNFRLAMAGNISKLEDYDKKRKEDKLLPIVPDLRKFNTLKLPALPTNYTMLMCNIEYPAKADKNPNGSLFMKPTQEILQAKAEDLGLTYFTHNMNIDDIIHWEDDEQTPAQQQENASFNYALKNPYIQMLLEADEENKTDQNSGAGRDSNFDPNGGIITGDIDNEIIGGELETHTEGKRTTQLNFFTGTVDEAIDGYMRNSIPVVQKLIKAICGNNQSKDANALETVIAQLLNAAEGKMSTYIKKNDTVIHQALDDQYQKEANKAKQYGELLKRINTLMYAYNKNQKFHAYVDSHDAGDAILNLMDDVAKDWSKTPMDLDMRLRTLFKGKEYNEIEKELYKETNKQNWTKFDESISIQHNHSLYEDEQYRDNTVGKNSNEILAELEKNLDTSYNEIRNLLTERMTSYINSDPKDWYIITSSRDRMNKLKEAADKEVNAKIELICRLAGEGKTDIGDKFKSAISKHPMRAEGLKRIWAMYSDDLQDRIEIRIRSIIGDNGNSNILTTIKQFLINVYPNLMATMLYYKEICFLISLYTRQHPLPSSLKKEEEEQSEEDKSIALRRRNNWLRAKNQTEKQDSSQDGAETPQN